MDFKEFVQSNELFNSPSGIYWQHRLVDDGRPKKATFNVGDYSYWVSFTGPTEGEANPKNLGKLNGRQEYLYGTQFDVFRNSKGEPFKNTLLNKFKDFIQKPEEDDGSFNFTPTKIGDEKQVLSSVLEAAKDFLQKVRPAILVWKGQLPKLGKLYKMVASQHADNLGYQLSPNPYGGSRLVRKDIVNTVLEKEKEPTQEEPPGVGARLLNKVTLNNPVLASKGWPYRPGDIKSLT